MLHLSGAKEDVQVDRDLQKDPEAAARVNWINCQNTHTLPIEM